MMKPSSFPIRSRSLWSLVWTTVVHVALAALVLRQPIRRLGLTPSAQRPIEFRLQARPRVRPAEFLEPRTPPPQPLQKRAPLPASAPVPRARLLPPTALPPGPAAPPEAPPQTEPRDLRKVDLLPGGVLRRLSETGLGTGPSTTQRQAAEGSLQAPNARLVGERVQGFIDTDLARERVRSGLVAPVWRELETTVADLYKPPESLVRSGHSVMTLGERFGNQVASITQQILRSPGQVESGTLARGAYAERGPTGMREDAFRSGRAAQQSKAAIDAWGKPGSWRRSEVELTIAATGELESVRLIRPCGVKKLDELAVETVEKAARKLLGAYRGKRTVTRWALASAYVANIPIGVTMDPNRAADVIGVHGGLTFDESGLGRKNQRGVGKYLSDPEHVAGGKLQTKVSLLSLQELPE